MEKKVAAAIEESHHVNNVINRTVSASDGWANIIAASNNLELLQTGTAAHTLSKGADKSVQEKLQPIVNNCTIYGRLPKTGSLCAD